MPGLFDLLLGRAAKRTEDIELPNESGIVDPRLPKPGQVRDSLLKSARTVKKFVESEGSSLDRLQSAGRRRK